MTEQNDFILPEPEFDSIKRTGWSATNVRIGQLQLGTVHIHDIAGSHGFRDFVDAQIARARRNRNGKAATRYLEPLPSSVPARLLSEEMDDYLGDMKRRNLSKSSLDNQARFFRLLRVATGDIPASEVNCHHIREFWEVIRWWPANMGSCHRYRGLSDQEIYALGKQEPKPPPAQATLELAEGMIATFFNSLVKMRVLPYSPMEGFGDFGDGPSEVNTRRGFTDEELEKVFDGKAFLKFARKAPHRWWGPRIGLYTGMRVGEVAQLSISDIAQDEGRWCFNIRVGRISDGGVSRRLKTKSSRRIIPVPQPLIDLGFLDFLEDAREVGHDRLFPHLKLGRKATGELNGVHYGSVLCRQFGDYLQRYHQIEKGLAFHCFRHNIINRLHGNGTPKALVATITGHWGRPDEQVFETMEKHYLKLPKEQLWEQQQSALSTFVPDVALPKYVRGQFAHCYQDRSKFHP